ncbi:MAG: hypothetical protein BGP12_18550 [Rhodospirillales bacterium 70-18]|nr:MAG: hypothetical protein BGP12_18550 [Rhodospirillales bacterium 70-18]
MTNTPLLPPSRAGTLELVGGMLALDFCNTSSGRGGARHLEHLRLAGDVVAWAAHAAVLDAAAAAALGARLAVDEGLATALLGRALALREAVFGIGQARAQGLAPGRVHLDELAATHAACLAPARLAADGAVYRWGWDPAAAPVEAVLGPIAVSAVGLLTQGEAGRLKQCQGVHCGWLFCDRTKNRSRRWCEMEVCGNRAKQRRRRGG